MTASQHILVVDDEETLCEALSFNLEEAGFRVDTAYSAEAALALPLSEYSLILLDIMMGRISGIQFAEILRKNPATANIPIIFCTARDSEDDVVEGLNLGADDYITKPYSMRTLLARVKAVLRRSATVAERETGEISVRGLHLSLESKTCMVDGEEVALPRKEFEILNLLMHHPNRVFTRDEILKAIWPDEVVVVDRVVDVNITRLRAKLGQYAKCLFTKPGYGYGFRD